jgi:outer membrane protein assembly factor BamB
MVRDYLKLSTAPEAVAIDDHDNFIIITSKSLLKVDNNAKTSTLINTGIWWHAALNTNSLIIKNSIVYAGMRAGVYEYDMNVGKEYWLLPY